MSERVLDAENWRLEAEAVVADIQTHVKSIVLLDGTDQKIHFNLTTLENKEYCIELSASGFRVVGLRHNKIDDVHLEYFETPYSLLCHISPSFVRSFGEELVEKLKTLQNAN